MIPPMTDMTIKAVRTTMLRVPWPDTPWLKGHAFGEARNLLVLEVETKGGIVGMGYLFSFRPGLKTVVAALEETILPHVIGKDATAVEGIWNDLWKRTVTYNRGGIVTMAMSALDIALWDAIGKRANMPVYQLFGGKCRDAVETYCHTNGRTFQEVEQAARRANESLDVDDLIIKLAIINEGRPLKRFTPAAMGRATPIRKRTSHVETVVAERGGR